MRRHHNRAQRILIAIAASVCWVVVSPAYARADLGDVNALRSQVAIVMGIGFGGAAKIVVDAVATDGGNAFAVFTSGDVRGYAVMRLRDGTWRLMANGVRLDQTGDWTDRQGLPPGLRCGHTTMRRPSVQEFVERDHFSSSLAVSAIKLLDLPPAPAPTAARPTPLVLPGIEAECTHGASVEATPDGYSVVLKRDPPVTLVTMPEFEARTGVGNATMIDATITTSVQSIASNPSLSGLSLYVWAPYVLDANETYIVTIRVPGEPTTTVQASLENNVLHFALPPIALSKNGIATLSISQAVRAPDIGPAQNTAAIRRAIPKLFADRMGGASVSVNQVFANETRGIALWTGGGNGGIAVMQKRNGLWWLMAYAMHPPHPNEWTEISTKPPVSTYCGSGDNAPPAPADLMKRFGLSPRLANTAAAAYSDTIPANSMPAAYNGSRRPAGNRTVYCDIYSYPGASVDGYSLDLTGSYPGGMPSLLAVNATPESATAIAALVHLTIASKAPLPGLKLHVWCPWVLEPASRYTLTLHLRDGSTKSVTGIVDSENNLQFVLPTLPIGPVDATHGTISVDPPAR
jgi:hypothetical protein